MQRHVIWVLVMCGVLAFGACKKKGEKKNEGGDTAAMTADDMKADDMKADDMKADDMAADDMKADDMAAAPPKAKTPIEQAAEDLKSTDVAVRRKALQGLVGKKDPKALPLLIGALKDQDIVVLSSALYNLRAYQAPEAVQPAVEAWNAPALAKVSPADQMEVKNNILQLLVITATPEAIKALKAFGKDKDKKAAANARKWLKDAKKIAKSRAKAQMAPK